MPILLFRNGSQALFIGDLTRGRVNVGEKMIKTYGVTHIALAVKDAQHAFESYRKIFGAKKVYDCRRKLIQSRQSKMSILSS